MLRTALGVAIACHLDDPSIAEVMLNPDGRLWIDRMAGGMEDTGTRINAADAERIMRLVAHHVGAEVHPACPRVSAELPGTGERFEGLLPPVVAAPCFAIRRPAVAVFSLADYVASAIMTATQADILREAVRQRRNILVVGGTSSRWRRNPACRIGHRRAEAAGTVDPGSRRHGAPRTVAIVNGTLAAALGLGLRLWVGGAVLWLLGQPAPNGPSTTGQIMSRTS